MRLLYMCAVVFLVFNSSVNSKKESGNHVQCGPENRCACTGSIEMDCSDRDVQLEEVCDYINSTTHFNVTVLRMDHLNKGIEMLRQSYLQGCHELVKLNLSTNAISKIETDTFRGFERLEMLDISNNYINLYNANPSDRTIFPASLKELNIIGNYNMSIYDNLSYPDLSELQELQNVFIDGLPFIDFNLSYRSLRELTKVTMSGLLGNCNISSVSNTTFINLSSVRFLNISACNIIDIEAFGFGSLSDLENLDLSWNMRLGFQAAKNITYGLQYTNIRVLNVSKIHTTFGPGTRIQIEDICYLYNTSINELDISGNRIEFAENNALAVLPESLNIFRVEHNKLTFRPYLLQLGCMKNFTEFYGSFQNFASTPLVFIDEYQGLNDRDYDKSEGTCPFLNEAFVKTDAMCPIFEPGERIDAIEIAKYLLKLPNSLRVVKYAQSNLNYAVRKTFAWQPSDQLEYIDLSGNVLHSWTGPFGTFKNLKHLDISKNYISFANRESLSFAKQTLENLQMHNNYFGHIFKDDQNGPFILNNFTELKTLNLSYNFISSVPTNLLLESHKVETLDFSFNSIEKWTLDVSQLDSLFHIILRNNFFQTLPKDLLNRLEENSKQKGKQFTIDLRSNTIQIDCERKDFLQWLVKHQNNMVGYDEYNFKNREGRSMTVYEFEREVSNLDKQCRSYTLIIVLSSIGLLTVLFPVIGGIIYRYRWKLRYILRYAKIKRFGYQPIHDGTDNQYRFDVFVSYANENSDFSRNKVYANLVQKGFKVCLHDKDFIPGNNIADNILDAIGNSRHTLVILSNDYLTSKWCMYEFNMARMESIYERDGSSCLLLVFLEDVPATKIPDEMLKWLDRNTYLKYTTDEQGELLFWENLERAVTAEM